LTVAVPERRGELEVHTDPVIEVPPTRKRHRRTWALLGAVLVIAGVGAAVASSHRSAVRHAPPAPHDGAPRLLVDKEMVDFGAVPFRKKIEATFELSNGGREVLEFTAAPYIEVVKGCCPPSPVLGKKSLQPGEKTTLSVSFMMYQGMGGLHDFRVHLKTNDPMLPDRTVQVLSDWK
jgi:hypothetical protein